MDKFEFKFDHKPDYSFLTVQLPANKTLKVEASAMATMDTNIEMKTKFKGGLKRFLGGESLFINEFTAQNGSGEITIGCGHQMARTSERFLFRRKSIPHQSFW